MNNQDTFFKICCVCDLSQPLSNFDKQTRGKDGYRARCKSCKKVTAYKDDSLPNETWKIIKNFPDYEVSNFARVRRAVTSNGGMKNRILQQCLNKGGYFTVAMKSNGKLFRKTVHSLVAAAFIGTRPKNLTVNHKDGKKINNLPENLEYLTVLQNIRHANRIGLIRKGKNHPSFLHPERLPRGDNHHARKHPEKMARGEKHGRARLSSEQVFEIKKELFHGGIALQIARRYGVSEGMVQGIKHNRTWKHIIYQTMIDIAE